MQGLGHNISHTSMKLTLSLRSCVIGVSEIYLGGLLLSTFFFSSLKKITYSFVLSLSCGMQDLKCST